MLNISYHMCAFLLAITTAMLWANVLGQQAQLLDEDEDVFGRPWPTYSLQNMPKTQFTCRDKILGGYYADPETQCQMFHVCVKLPGVGLSHRRVNSFVQQVQDYRFLCPNSTAFDQELQICANWADVDCDKAPAYYDGNNLNDLYRGGEESKSPNQGEEEEGTFHLQRAESGDVRRSKENRGDQKSRPRHNYGQTASSGSADSTQTTRRPITSYYTPTTTTTTTTTSTERSYYNNHNYNNNNDDSKQDIDDIFKGSHSSHFFANRHGGREFDEEPAVVARSRPNDFNDYSRKTTETASKTRATPTRAQRTSSQIPAFTATTTTTSSTSAPTSKSLKKITLHAAYNTGFPDYTQHHKSSTPSSVPPTAGTTPRLGSGITSRFSFGVNDYQTQERIQPTTYNPNNGYRFKSTELPASSTKLTGKNAQDFDKETTRRHNKPTVAARKQKLGPQESNYINHNEFAELPKAKLQQPQPFQATSGATRKPAQLEPQYQRPRANGQQLTRVGSQEPAPFKTSSAAKPRTFTSRGSITYKATTQRYADDEFYYPTTTSTTANPSKKLSTQAYTPTTFKPTTYKKSYETNYYQAPQTLRPSQSASPKKTSAVTPQSVPTTTANPYYNVDEDDGQYHPELYENDFPRNRFKFLRNRSTSSGTTTSTTSAPVVSRQPHGFHQAHSHLKSQQQSAYQKEREQEQSDLSDEDELFKTAQSLNFGAASINKLRADIYKAEKTSQQYNSQYSPQLAPSSPKTTAQTSSSPTTTTTTSTTRRPTTTTTTTTTITTKPTTSSALEPKKSAKSKKEDKKSKSKRPPHADEDTSYDYAYYDTD
ncbi:mucin-5AC [Drosophila novamexicana]|uniref:mucin-5AC n=1 Tax=Drosophila novamexicana TaxID=47314 RepID=UPI0011E59625|nr:mucin-5AC [Drosophila novamexicana]